MIKPMRIWRVTIELKDVPEGHREKHLTQEAIFEHVENNLRDFPAGVTVQILGMKDLTP